MRHRGRSEGLRRPRPDSFAPSVFICASLQSGSARRDFFFLFWGYTTAGQTDRTARPTCSRWTCLARCRWSSAAGGPCPSAPGYCLPGAGGWRQRRLSSGCLRGLPVLRLAAGRPAFTVDAGGSLRPITPAGPASAIASMVPVSRLRVRHQQPRRLVPLHLCVVFFG
jgi:hypothetical protein